MKNLILIILLLPLFATAQINGTIQKTASSGTVRGSFGSAGIDTLPRVTGVLLNGRVLTYNSVLNKWTASMVGTSSIDTTQIRTVANSVSLAELQTRLNAKEASLTFSTGLTRSTNTISIDQGFSPTWGGNHIFTQQTEFRGSGDDNHNILFNQLSGSNTVKQGIDFKDGNGVIRSAIKQIQTDFASGATELAFYNGFSNTKRFSINSDGASTFSGNVSISNTTSELAIVNTTATTGKTWKLISNASNGFFYIQQPSLGNPFYINGTTGVVTLESLDLSGDVIVAANNAGELGKITVGSGLSLSAGVLTATGGSSGSVTTAGGTAGKIAKFTSASNIENSIMTESGSTVSVAGTMSATTFSGSGTDLTGTAAGLTAGLVSTPSNTAGGTYPIAWTNGTNGLFFTSSITVTPSTGVILASNLSGTNTGDQDLSSLAPKASPAFTGTPTAPTATAGTNTTQLATTAFVQSAASSGTYTPTVASVSNTSAFTVYNSHYMRVGNEVTVMVQVEANSTTTSAGSFSVTLPVASNMTAFTDLSGTGSTNGSFTINPVITGDAISDLAIVEFTKGAIGTNRFFLTFMYTVL